MYIVHPSAYSTWPLGRPIRVTVPSVTVAPTALVGSLIRSSNLPHSLQRGVQCTMYIPPPPCRLTSFRLVCLSRVSGMSHVCLTRVSGMSHVCLTRVSGMSHVCLSRVSGMSHVCLTRVSGMSHVCLTRLRFRAYLRRLLCCCLPHHSLERFIPEPRRHCTNGLLRSKSPPRPNQQQWTEATFISPKKRALSSLSPPLLPPLPSPPLPSN